MYLYYLAVGDGITSICGDSNKNDARNLGSKKEARSRCTKEAEETVHTHIDEEQDDEETEKCASSEFQTHHEISANFKQ
jgi:hypothetical protein